VGRRKIWGIPPFKGLRGRSRGEIRPCRRRSKAVVGARKSHEASFSFYSYGFAVGAGAEGGSVNQRVGQKETWLVSSPRGHFTWQEDTVLANSHSGWAGHTTGGKYSYGWGRRMDVSPAGGDKGPCWEEKRLLARKPNW